MYKIIGADKQEYGPITLEELRRWMNEGRVNGLTLISVDGGPFQPLAGIAELAGLLPLSPPPMPANPEVSEDIQKTVSNPATFLLVAAALSLLGGLLGILANVFQISMGSFLPMQQPGVPEGMLKFQGTVAVVSNLVGIAFQVVIIIGAWKMRQLRSYGWAMTAAIMALLCANPCCCPLGLAAGIWSIVVLSKSEVKAAFQ